MTELRAQYRLEYPYRRNTGPVLGVYFAALRAGRLLGARLSSGRVLGTPAEYDPDTGQAVTDLVPIGPGGVVVSHAFVANPSPGHPQVRPFAFALIRPDGAETTLTSVLELARPESLVTGLRVTARFRPDGSGTVRDLYFVPEAEGSGQGSPAAPAESSEDPAQPGAQVPDAAPLAPVGEIVTPLSLAFEVVAGRQLSRFLTALMERRFTGARCPRCEKTYTPPRGACPTCGVPTDDAVLPIAETGTVTTFCVINFPFPGQVLEPPYVGAAIVLDGADVPIFHLVGGIEPANVRMGMRVRALWGEKPVPSLEYVRYFAPMDEPDLPFAAIAEHL